MLDDMQVLSWSGKRYYWSNIEQNRKRQTHICSLVCPACRLREGGPSTECWHRGSSSSRRRSKPSSRARRRPRRRRRRCRRSGSRVTSCRSMKWWVGGNRSSSNSSSSHNSSGHRLRRSGHRQQNWSWRGWDEIKKFPCVVGHGIAHS